MLITPYRSAMSCASSTLILQNLTSLRAVEASSSTGMSIRHGIQYDAQKSTTTIRFSARTSEENVSLVNSMTATA